MNELLFFIAIIMNFLCVTLAYKFFNKTGIYAWIALATVIANIEVVKCVDIFGLPLTLGNVTYGSIFLASDILNEKYGREKAQKGVFLGFFALLILTVFTQIDLLYIPSCTKRNANPVFFNPENLPRKHARLLGFKHFGRIPLPRNKKNHSLG